MPGSVSISDRNWSRWRTSVSVGLDGDDRRRVRGPVEDRQLAEELARSEDRDDRRLGALVARQDDLDRAGRDDEQRVARVALVEDRLAAAEAADAENVDEGVDRRVVGGPEQAAQPQRVGGEALITDRHS